MAQMFSSTSLYEPAEKLTTQTFEMIMDETSTCVVTGYILQESNARPASGQTVLLLVCLFNDHFSIAFVTWHQIRNFIVLNGMLGKSEAVSDINVLSHGIITTYKKNSGWKPI
jgi:hypothetical protein